MAEGEIMGLTNPSLLKDATVTSTGGTAVNYVRNGQQVNNGFQVVDVSVVDARVRPTITIKSIPARLSANGEYTSDKREVVLTFPKVLAAGVVRFPNWRITATLHPENSEAEIVTQAGLTAQVLLDPDFQNLLKYGSVA